MSIVPTVICERLRITVEVISIKMKTIYTAKGPNDRISPISERRRAGCRRRASCSNTSPRRRSCPMTSRVSAKEFVSGNRVIYQPLGGGHVDVCR
ncbi:hypothetical protein EVAR_93110_1 [Eumeta japonica]|uniref:Uncharacterized protein n=1 Tax=Eumeta variegata TaxID=151549 RepID=A0A4C1TI83_EUMVA|nr:hypothetical protein EVAR_93110_1 [Eumeta japonica]